MELLQLTDPKKVTFELDCGWAIIAGVNPTEIMKNHPYWIHDAPREKFQASAKVTELGHRSVDYRPSFAQAAKTQHISMLLLSRRPLTCHGRNR